MSKKLNIESQNCDINFYTQEEESHNEDVACKQIMLDKWLDVKQDILCQLEEMAIIRRKIFDLEKSEVFNEVRETCDAAGRFYDQVYSMLCDIRAVRDNGKI